jgi:RHS repeat-associated protein
MSYGCQQGVFHRLTSTQQASYTFDANGNVTSKSEGTTKWYYSYDRENRLTNATKFGGLIPRAGASVNYHYDALGRRVIRQDKKTGRTEFTHDGMDVLQDRKLYGDTTTTTNYVNGLGIDDKLKITTGSTSKYFLTDHLGSTVGLSDTNGVVNESASYDSFGRTLSSSLTTRYQYTGREADEATGLMYYRARFYDSQIGRFTSEDPIGFAGGDVNLYGYVMNNPLGFADPFGLSSDGGPYHPPDGVRVGCRNTDSCEAIRGKMWVIQRMINSHTGWDRHVPPPRGGNRHAVEIGEVWAAWANCQAIYERNCNKPAPPFMPIPVPVPVHQPQKNQQECRAFNRPMLPVGPTQFELNLQAQSAQQYYSFWQKVTFGGYLISVVLTRGAVFGAGGTVAGLSRAYAY